MPATPEKPIEIEVRTARSEDAAGMAELLGQLGYRRTPDDVRALTRQSKADSESVILVAAAADNRITGCMQAVVTRRLAEGDRAEIASLVVDAAWRGRGVGTRLVRAAAERLQAQGVTDLRVRCNIKRKRAHRFYEQFGFREAKIQKVFDLPLAHGAD